MCCPTRCTVGSEAEDKLLLGSDLWCISTHTQSCQNPKLNVVWFRNCGVLMDTHTSKPKSETEQMSVSELWWCVCPTCCTAGHESETKRCLVSELWCVYTYTYTAKAESETKRFLFSALWCVFVQQGVPWDQKPKISFCLVRTCGVFLHTHNHAQIRN